MLIGKLWYFRLYYITHVTVTLSPPVMKCLYTAGQVNTSVISLSQYLLYIALQISVLKHY